MNSTTPKTLTFGDLVSHVESGLDVIQVPEAGLLRRYEKVYARLLEINFAYKPHCELHNPQKPLPSGIWFPMLSPALT